MTSQTAITPTEVRHEPDGQILEFTDIPIEPMRLDLPHNRILRHDAIGEASPRERGTLLSMAWDLFVEEYQSIRFGPCIQGAVFELELQAPGRLSYLDGYLTVGLGFGSAHFHLCIGPHQGLKHDTPSALAEHRQCKRASFVRGMGDTGCTPGCWDLRMWNGKGEQMISFFLPSPFLSDKLKPLREPDWSHLRLWNDLRARYLGEEVPQALPAA